MLRFGDEWISLDKKSLLLIPTILINADKMVKINQIWENEKSGQKKNREASLGRKIQNHTKVQTI